MILLKWILKSHPKVKLDIKALDKKDKQIVRKSIERIKLNPLRYKRLTSYKDLYSFRAGKIRIIYLLKDSIIWIIIIEKRSKVYSLLSERYDTLGPDVSS